MSHNAFIDSCIFIAYGTEFEDFHSACVRFFETTECKKYTSESVEKELSLKLKKRNKLYRDYSKYLTKRGSEEYEVSPDIYLNDNDLRHLNELVNHLCDVPAHEQLTFLRQFSKRLELRIKTAIGILEEIIPRNNDTYFKALINSIIPNEFDSQILNDAIQWSLTCKDNVVFVTLDSEIYYNGDKLLQMVKEFKSLSKSPIQIIHGNLFHKS